MRNRVTRRYRSEYQGVCTCLTQFAFLPERSRPCTHTKIASKKIRSSNHHHQQKQQKHHRSPIPKNALFFFCLSFLVRGFARVFFVTERERERGAKSSIVYNTFVGIPYPRFFFPKGRAFFKKKEKKYLPQKRRMAILRSKKTATSFVV